MDVKIEELLGNDSSFADLTNIEKNSLREALLIEMERRERHGSFAQIRDIIPIEQWLDSEYYLGENCRNVYDYWKDLLKDVYDTKRGKEDRINELILSGCFTGDTEIALYDGRNVSMVDLVEEYGMNKSFWVHSCNSEGVTTAGKAFCVRKTGISKEILRIVLDSGDVIKCTLDHKFMLHDGSYRLARYLQSGDELKSIGSYNHSILEVSFSSKREDVYDFEVEDYHNFALSSGVFVHNSLGIGKSTVAIIVLLRRFYELSCFKNITNMFNLMSTSSIVFLYFSVNKYQANLTGFGDLKSFLDSIPYFNEHFQRNRKIDSLILLPENLMVTYGSGAQHSIGMNMLGSVLDEANFIQGKSNIDTGTTTSKVADLYTTIINRSRSRFIQEGGTNLAISILVSSATHASSFTEQRMNQVRGDKNVIIKTPNLWEVKPKNYSGRRFWVFKGNNVSEPFVADTMDSFNNYRIAEGMAKYSPKNYVNKNPDSYRNLKKAIGGLPPFNRDLFMEVPKELKDSFETNIIQALQDLGGVSVAPMGKLFTAGDIYKKSCTDQLTHPFVSESIVISTGDTIRVRDYIRSDYKFVDKFRPRYLHIDQSAVTDSTGISCVHVGNLLEVDGVKKPMIVVDFMIQINPPRPPKRLAIYKLRDFVASLKIDYGLKIGRVSYDMWNSEESRQILGELGLEVAQVSVDKNDKAYLDLVVMLYELRLKMYNYPVFHKELFNLVHDRNRRKVDHPKTNDDGTVGSKDVADSLVGAIQGALLSDYVDTYYDGIGDFLRGNRGGISSYDDVERVQSTESLINKIIEAEIDSLIDEY